MSKKVPESYISGSPRRLTVNDLLEIVVISQRMASASFAWIRLVINLAVFKAMDLLCYEWHLLEMLARGAGSSSRRQALKVCVLKLNGSL
jgi:hypothetical protein